jgi:imidazolonepropionase-like amidohydrolase
MMEIASSNIIDGTGRPPIAGRIRIAGQQIRDVSPGAGAGGSGDAVDLDGYTILPGLIDAHSHLGSVIQPHGSPPPPIAVIAAEIFKNAERAVREGFTTVREVAGLDGGLNEAAGRGLVLAPRVLPSGPMISQTCGHGDWRPKYDHGPWGERWPGLVQASVVVDGVTEAVKAARLALRDGATQLKVSLSGGFSSDCDALTDTQFGEDELAAIVAVARSQGRYVTGHAHHSHAVQLGLRAGVACFEHATFVDQETLMLIKQNDAAIVATLGVLRRLQDPAVRDGLREELREFARSGFDSAAEMVRAAVAAGILVGLGTDITGADQHGRAREVAQRCSATDPLEAIAAATGKNAKVLRIADRTGTLTPGLLADLVVLDGNPLTEPVLFEDPERVRLVMAAGQIRHDTLPAELSAQVRRACAPGTAAP